MQILTELPRLSASKIQTFVNCKSSYLAKYFHGLKPAVETTWGIYGSAVHAGIEAAYKGEFPYSAADQVIEKRFAELDAVPYIGYTRQQVTAKTYKILDSFDYDLYSPRFMEYEFLLPFYDLCDLHGFIDLITTDGRIIDFKTNSKPQTQKEVNNSIQLAIYKWAYTELTQEKPTQVAIHHLPTNRLIVADPDSLDEVLEQVRTVHIPAMLALTAEDEVTPCKNCNPFCALKDWTNGKNN